MIVSEERFKELLRDTLTDQAKTGNATTYRELADRLRLSPPQTIHRLTQALEFLMEEDVAAGAPDAGGNLHEPDSTSHSRSRILHEGPNIGSVFR